MPSKHQVFWKELPVDKNSIDLFKMKTVIIIMTSSDASHGFAKEIKYFYKFT